MEILKLNPSVLRPNPWNTNKLTPESELKLEESIRSLGMFKPAVVRTLEDGSFQILGGEHRAIVAGRMGIDIEVVNLGVISDDHAKKIGLVDNARYGHDDTTLLAELLRDLGPAVELATFLPYDPKEVDAMLAVARVDLDSIGFEEDDQAPVPDVVTRATKTHTTMKFRVPLEDQATIEATIKAICEGQGFDDSDSSVRAGDALVWLINNLNPKEDADEA